MLRCCFGVSAYSNIEPSALLLQASVSEGDPKEQDRVHLVKPAHLAINAQPAGPLTGTYKKLSKNLRGNPHEVSRFLHSFQAHISTYLRCYSVDTLCKPLFIKDVLHCTNSSQSTPEISGEQPRHDFASPHDRRDLACHVDQRDFAHSGTATCSYPAQEVTGSIRPFAGQPGERWQVIRAKRRTLHKFRRRRASVSVKPARFR